MESRQVWYKRWMDVVVYEGRCVCMYAHVGTAWPVPMYVCTPRRDNDQATTGKEGKKLLPAGRYVCTRRRTQPSPV